MFCFNCEYSGDFQPGDATVDCTHPYFRPADGAPPEYGCCYGHKKPEPPSANSQIMDDIVGQTGLFDDVDKQI